MTALKKVAHWDVIETERPLSLSELEEKVAAVEEFKSWALLEETTWRKNQEKSGLRRVIGIHGFSIGWKIRIKRGIVLAS